MEKTSLKRSGVFALLLLCAGSVSASAQDWARDMFDKTSHDFGTVARGAKVEHRFTVENIYVEDARIVSARTSCGCTTPEITKHSLKTWEKAEIVVKVDTRGYRDQKDVTVTIVFDRPFPAEVRLQIHCFIRGDLVVQPGVVQFGTVAQGSGGQQRVAVTYAGNPNWQIQQVQSNNAAFSAQAVQVARGGGQAAYDLTVTLAKNAPPGNYREQVYLVTNDANPRTARVPVPVEAIVQPGVTVHPETLFMGTVAPGKSVTRSLVVRGAAPFRVLAAASSDPRFRCAVPEGAAALHRIPVTFQAGNALERAVATIRIDTDSGTSLQATADAQVVAAAVQPLPGEEAADPLGVPIKPVSPGQPAPAAKPPADQLPPSTKPAPESPGSVREL